jgi:Family of unknown function (DUF5994)
MVTHTHATRFALRPVFDRELPDGAWWPENRRLSDQLGRLFAFWPPEGGRIARVLYSPPDWDDRPRSVAVPGRMIKTGSFPRDDTHLLTLSLRDGRRRSITVIPPDTPTQEATEVLDAVTGVRHDSPRYPAGDDQPEWDNEGGHF